MIGWHYLGGVCSHIKAFGFSPFLHQNKVCAEGFLGRRALTMLGRTLLQGRVWQSSGTRPFDDLSKADIKGELEARVHKSITTPPTAVHLEEMNKIVTEEVGTGT